MAEYEAEAAAVRAKMARLKELRLARDAAGGGPPAPVRKSVKVKKSGKPEKRPTGSLSDWLKDRENSGRRSLEHDPEKWTPVFGKDHAPPIS